MENKEFTNKDFFEFKEKINDKTIPFKDKFNGLLRILKDKSIDGNYKKVLVQEFKNLEEEISLAMSENLNWFREKISKDISAYELMLAGIFNFEDIEMKIDKIDVKESLLNDFKDIKLIEYLLKSKKNLEDKYKQVLLFNNKEKIDLDKYINYISDSNKKFQLIMGMGEEYIERYIHDINRRGTLRARLILATKNEDYITKCILDNSLSLAYIEKGYLLTHLKDKDFLSNYFEKNKDTMNVEELQYIVIASDNKEIEKYWREKTINIDNTSELSEQDLEKNPTKEIIDVGDGSRNSVYRKEEYIKVKKAMDKLMEGISKSKENPFDQAKAVLDIATRIAKHVSYNFLAIQKEMKNDDILQRECRNLYGGLINREAVCLGYATILMDALKRIGIECKCIRGVDLESGGKHAWNQVRIGNKWFNVDLTNYRDNIIEKGKATLDMLQEDKEFLPNSIYNVGDSEERELCDVKAIDYIMNNIELGENKDNNREDTEKAKERGNIQEQRNKDYDEIE